MSDTIIPVDLECQDEGPPTASKASIVQLIIGEQARDQASPLGLHQSLRCHRYQKWVLAPQERPCNGAPVREGRHQGLRNAMVESRRRTSKDRARMQGNPVLAEGHWGVLEGEGAGLATTSGTTTSGRRVRGRRAVAGRRRKRTRRRRRRRRGIKGRRRRRRANRWAVARRGEKR
ncbi:hypothetical protein TGRH88_030790 [Toxoplasma gondii]|uniref:Uncharacterized protein n=1 Tax=Toxoplasma gondii TaxID=5811 RepID=A0A7J6K7H0_TOXGO|nr:hypothetical protein TGRH88_030790 [Toxoplasma gondii]